MNASRLYFWMVAPPEPGKCAECGGMPAKTHYGTDPPLCEACHRERLKRSVADEGAKE